MITAFVVGDDKVIARFNGLNDRLMNELVRATRLSAASLAAYIQKDKLSGQVLRNITGRLRRSITFQTIERPDSTTATVGTNVEYAHALEYGFKGPVNVREHLRMQKVAFGRPMKDPRQVTVRAHTMNMNVPGRSFLRSSLAEKADEIRSGYEHAIQRALR